MILPGAASLEYSLPLMNTGPQIGVNVLLGDYFKGEEVQRRRGLFEHQMIHKVTYTE